MAQWKKILLGIAGFLTVLAGGSQVDNLIGGRLDTTHTILNAVTNVNSSTSVVNVNDYSDAVCTIDWNTNPSSTVKFYGSIAETQPTFSASQSTTNQWENLGFTDMDSLSNVAGATGISASTTPDHRMVKIDLKYINWFTARITTSTSGINPVTSVCIFSNTR